MNPRKLAQAALGVECWGYQDLMTGSPANIFTWVSAGPESRLGLVYIYLIRLGRNNPDVYQLLNVFSHSQLVSYMDSGFLFGFRYCSELDMLKTT